MPAVILDMRVIDRSQFVGLSTTYAKIRRQAMLETAQRWHTEIFPAHFGGSNRQKYRLAPRKPLYLQKIKPQAGVGEGRFRDLVLVGRSQRALRNLVRITGTSNRVVVRMNAPGYFVRPFVGTWVDPKTGKRRSITRQPNKPDEVTRWDSFDRGRLRQIAARHLSLGFFRARQQAARNWATDGI